VVAVPSGIKVFNWTATLWGASIRFTAPMLFALCFLILFSIGGLTGLFLGMLNVDMHLHDTYFVVAHFHYVMVGGTLTSFLAGLHHWWPKITGRMYSEKLARVAAGLYFVGFNTTFFPQFILGSLGQPRRTYNYGDQFQLLHVTSTHGSWILGAGFLVMLYYLVDSLIHGQRAPENPWGGLSLEWKTASPPITQNFVHQPVVSSGPYEFAPAKEGT
jgi:cytochrome c oxidase subunit 1